MMKYSIAFIFFVKGIVLHAQHDSLRITYNKADTTGKTLNMDAVYNRPFLQVGKTPVSIGGYVEANSSYFMTDGVTNGLSFQIPRLTLFVSSSIKKRLTFLTEIELEEGGRHVSIEFASLDVALHPLLNLRGGIVMNPIGAFNQNHDGPKWEFISRPLSATTIIPSTWSNVGFGAFGKYAIKKMIWAYEVYITNGFDDKIIANTQNKTWLPASKENPMRFQQSFNGVPLITAKAAFRYGKIAEVGVSWMGGVYNKFEQDGLLLDVRRRIDVCAVDANTTLPKLNTRINGEWAWAFVNVPTTYTQLYGNKLHGGFLDVVQPVLKRKILGWEKSIFNVVVRTEYVDYNVGNFKETGGSIGEYTFALTPGISFRPSAQTVVRFNYRYQWDVDMLNNPPAQTAGFQFGFSTYF